MVRQLMAWAAWSVMFLCACSTTVPAIRARPSSAEALVVRPAGFRPVELSREEYRDGMRMMLGHGWFPGITRGEPSRFVLAGVDPVQLQKAAGYLQHCQRIGHGHRDCWAVLTEAGGLDQSGTREVALRFAFAEALQDAATAVGNITPEQVRAILALTLVGTIVAILDPNPFTKTLFIIAGANLIAFIGVDLFNSVVKGYTAMAEELKAARDFAAVRAAGERYGQRLGPTLARIVVMVATYGVARFAGLMPGGATSLPGGPRAAALAEAQGFRIPAVEGAQSIGLAADGSVTIHLGAAATMASAARPPGSSERIGARYNESRADHIFRSAPGHVNPATAESRAQFIRLFEQVASSPSNLRPDAVRAGLITPQAAEAGVQVYTWTSSNGQVWVTVRNGLIENAGVNPPGGYR